VVRKRVIDGDALPMASTSLDIFSHLLISHERCAGADAFTATVFVQILLAQRESAIMTKIVAVTSCPTGIAHTFMAAEGLQRGAEALGHTIKVETQGSVGAENTLTDAEIRDANLVIIAADAKVDTSRFAGKPIYETSTNAAIKDGQAVVKTALAQARSATPQ